MENFLPKTQPIIETRGLSKSFRVRGKEIQVLCDLDFSVAPGDVVVVSGKSGTGKSVLLWLLSGLDQPTGGEVVFKGRSLSDLSNAALAELRRNQIGIVFQNFNLVTSWTAYENVAAVLDQSNLTQVEIRQKATAILSDLGLSERLDNLPAELSIGQQQRVAVARTLATCPSLILADEPTGGVDPETAAEIIEMLLNQVRDHGATMVVTTHGSFPSDKADRVVKLSAERIN